MIDTHCHLDSTRFDPDRDQVIARAFEAGVTGIVVPAVGPSDWEALFRFPDHGGRIRFGLGIHPQLLPQLPEAEDAQRLEELDALLTRGRGVVLAVGECGLDGPSVDAGAPMERQLRVLEGHLALARKHDLPVLLHCLRAHPALLELLGRVPLPGAGIVLHSYSGAVDLARRYARHDCHFSFAGPVTYPGARRPIEALKVVPPGRLLVETDAPDQAPSPHRGTRSEPAYVVEIARAMAAALGEDVETLAGRTVDNTRRLFRGAFPPPRR